LHQTRDKMNPRQMREYKHSQRVKAEEMRQKNHQAKMRAEMEQNEQMKAKYGRTICDWVEKSMEAESEKADWVYGKGAKGKMEVNIKLEDDRVLVYCEFKPAEGVRPIEGRKAVGQTVRVDFSQA
jgi:hypothetical protein